PEDSRAAKPHGFLKRKDIDDRRLSEVRALNELARKRGQSLAQMALAWVLRQPAMTSAHIGASRVEQVDQNLAAARFCGRGIVGDRDNLAALTQYPVGLTSEQLRTETNSCRRALERSRPAERAPLSVAELVSAGWVTRPLLEFLFDWLL